MTSFIVHNSVINDPVCIMQASPSRSISDKRDPAASLAKLTLQKFEVGTKMISNGEMIATVSMEDCLLDDGRPEKKNGITRYSFRGILSINCPFYHYFIIVCLLTT